MPYHRTQHALHMILVQDVLISDDIISEEFICNITACKGACCWEGDFGAPLTEEECTILEENTDKIAPYINEQGKKTIEQKGCHTRYDGDSFSGTMLEDSGACSYMVVVNGIAQCGIERAYRDGAIHWRKPQSCYLYPIRVVRNEESGFEAWNYSRWHICNDACALGKKEKVKIYQFLKDPIIAYKGVDFYNELEAAARHYSSQQQK